MLLRSSLLLFLLLCFLRILELHRLLVCRRPGRRSLSRPRINSTTRSRNWGRSRFLISLRLRLRLRLPFLVQAHRRKLKRHRRPRSARSTHRRRPRLNLLQIGSRERPRRCPLRPARLRMPHRRHRQLLLLLRLLWLRRFRREDRWRGGFGQRVIGD